MNARLNVRFGGRGTRGMVPRQLSLWTLEAEARDLLRCSGDRKSSDTVSFLRIVITYVISIQSEG